ncbi:MAG: hypothetical protein FMNOHCHN_03788 [Ignavibacteriaceae bacterium]|nr:hypothetical protein [Ignavibacteriaceae bacterium]
MAEVGNKYTKQCGFERLTSKEKRTVYRAMNLIEKDISYYSCNALADSIYTDLCLHIILDYRKLYATSPTLSWLDADKLSKGLTREEIQQWRLTMLAWFAEVGRIVE